MRNRAIHFCDGDILYWSVCPVAYPDCGCVNRVPIPIKLSNAYPRIAHSDSDGDNIPNFVAVATAYAADRCGADAALT